MYPRAKAQICTMSKLHIVLCSNMSCSPQDLFSWPSTLESDTSACLQRRSVSLASRSKMLARAKMSGVKNRNSKKMTFNGKIQHFPSYSFLLQNFPLPKSLNQSLKRSLWHYDLFTCCLLPSNQLTTNLRN